MTQSALAAVASSRRGLVNGNGSPYTLEGGSGGRRRGALPVEFVRGREGDVNTFLFFLWGSMITDSPLSPDLNQSITITNNAIPANQHRIYLIQLIFCFRLHSHLTFFLSCFWFCLGNGNFVTGWVFSWPRTTYLFHPPRSQAEMGFGRLYSCLVCFLRHEEECGRSAIRGPSSFGRPHDVHVQTYEHFRLGGSGGASDGDGGV